MFPNRAEMIQQIMDVMQDAYRSDRFLQSDQDRRLFLSPLPPSTCIGDKITLGPYVHVPWVREFDCKADLVEWAEALIERLEAAADP